MSKTLFIGLLLVFSSISAFSMSDIQLVQDTIIKNDKPKTFLESKKTLKDKQGEQADSIPTMTSFAHGDDAMLVTVKADSVIKFVKPFKPTPTKALLYSLIPGGGQIYNKKYWKLPLVYGGFLGITYAITWNGRMYSDYSDAYHDLVTGDGRERWRLMISGNYSGSVEEAQRLYTDKFRRKKDNFRRNRDLAIICSVGLYALCMIDAYVDAHLYNFDVSPDLAMRIEPIIFEPYSKTRRGYGLQCSITF